MTAQLEPPESESEVFAVARRFSVPRERLWQVWTEGTHLAKWWTPGGMTLGIKSIDFRPGGSMLYGMHSPFGHVHWGKFTYRLVEPERRLAYVATFTDAEGAPVRNPMNPLWPLEMLTDQRFEEVEGGSELRSRSYPINATPAERHMFLLGHAGLQMTFAGTIGNLETYLAQ